MGYISEFSSYASNVLALVLKLTYPTYMSFKAIKSNRENDDTTWLIYWAVVAVESFIASYVFPFISWVPFFMIIRILFYIWLQIPIFNGSVILFNNFIKPFYTQNEDILNKIIPGDPESARKAREEFRHSINETYDQIYSSIKTKKT